jgi:dTMP kinase
LLLVAAARDDHVRRLVRPAIEQGAWVLCDRFVDSTRVYQGMAGGLGCEPIDQLHDWLLGGLVPDLTVLLDIDPETGLRRRHAAGADGRFERKGEAFHLAVRAGFRALADREPERFVVIDAARPVQDVARMIWSAVSRRLSLAA